METRIVEENDIDKISEIHHQSMVYSEGYDKSDIDAMSFEINYVPEKLTNPFVNYTIVAEVDTVVVGWSSYNYEYNILDGVFVDPEYQNRGIGTNLINSIEEYAMNYNEHIIVYANPHLLEYYKDLGYEYILEKEIRATDSESIVSCIVMKKDL